MPGPDTVRRSRPEYLDHAAATDQGQAYKRQMIEAMNLQPGQSVLDVGCGPGTDLAQLADKVGGSGTVLGVDADPLMVSEAQRRLTGRANIQVRDAHALGVGDASVDRVRMYTRFVATQVARNGAIGPQLPRLAVDAGFHVSSVAAIPIVFNDYEAVEAILRLHSVMDRAVRAGAIDAHAARPWLNRMSSETYLAAVTAFMVVAQRPA